MKVTRKSQLSGIEHTLDLPTVTQERLDECWSQSSTGEGKHIQDVFPELTADEREFLMTGVTAEEWAAAFPPEEDDDYVSICPACGNPIDYCQGHGDIGDP